MTVILVISCLGLLLVISCLRLLLFIFIPAFSARPAPGSSLVRSYMVQLYGTLNPISCSTLI